MKQLKIGYITEQIKDNLQFWGFLIFKVLAKQKSQISSFNIIETENYSKKIIRLYKNDTVVMSLYETYNNEWVIEKRNHR